MISVIVPVFNEQDNIEPLINEILAAAAHAPITEIVYVDDASRDATLETLKKLQPRNPILKIVHHAVQAGQSAAMYTGAQFATQELIVFLDGDGQNNPADIALLYEAYAKTRSDARPLLVAGQRQRRQDTLVKKISSRLANAIRRAVLRDNTPDTGCSLKLMPRATFLKLPFFNHLHRYIPALMLREGAMIAHVGVGHRPRARGVSKYGFWDRLWAGVFDLVGVAWLLTRGRPKDFKAMEI